MDFDEDFVNKITHITSDDNKMLLLNNRYYCELTVSQKSRNVEPNYYFSDFWKEENSPTLTQYADCYVIDGSKRQYGKLYHSVNNDLMFKHTFSLMLQDDKTLVSVITIENVAKEKVKDEGSH